MHTHAITIEIQYSHMTDEKQNIAQYMLLLIFYSFTKLPKIEKLLSCL